MGLFYSLLQYLTMWSTTELGDTLTRVYISADYNLNVIFARGETKTNAKVTCYCFFLPHKKKIVFV